MKRHEVKGGWHGENLPGGEYAVSIRGQRLIETHQGPVKGEELLFTRCCAVPVFRIAGQQQNGTQNVEWNEGFSPIGPSYGVNPVCFDQEDGQLYQGKPSLGSQGIRYIDNSIIWTGDSTYAIAGKIYEWTERGDVVIGQGPQGGAIAITPEATYLIEEGDCRFVRFNRQNDSLAITIVKLVEGKTVLLWLTRDELKSFPLYEITAENPPNNPPPAKEPEPSMTPIVPQTEIDRAKTMLAEVRREWNFGSGQNDSPYVREVAARLGGSWGLNGKRGDPQNVSHDILAWKVPGEQPVLFDVLIDGGGANGPAFEQLPWPEPAGAIWLDPGKPQNAPGKPQDAPGSTQGPTPDLTPLVQAINALGASNEALVTFVKGLEARIVILENKQSPKFKIRGADPDGKLSTGRSFGHGHQMTLIIDEVK